MPVRPRWSHIGRSCAGDRWKMFSSTPEPRYRPYRTARFIITNSGSGHIVPGARYKEYRLQDYSSWFVKQLDDTEKWARLKSCLVKTDDCNNLSKRYKTAREYKLADLTPMESGCCRPPAECGYPALNASYFDLSYHPVSTNVDCKLYKNARSVRCYDCNSCKAGVAQYMKTEWRVVAIFNVILFIILSETPVSDTYYNNHEKYGSCGSMKQAQRTSKLSVPW
ncbi:unnamed protein product [Miscanthus lutarioriparius]|uniref:Tetraspanin-10 n=1 Tax=Miscanthus lutarioriparius TaxID=422564 RepID=A0A811N0I4_9POAL|nr:unnamed protein product [Miscanthus lutarioriparius]